ncbi:hypothetical protein DSO57_1028247 [Entomophthora muscae]|uniref:Uncharacterized protein n=1 Tax=Entomophthora muscae TaxID=34485 RepID=A0ACC2UB51_9FUNG|nr:hypothetical protein DSO57_1028247 [Entomophthora muscae]
MPLARLAPPAIKLTAQNQKATADVLNITNTTKAKPGALNNDINKINREVKKDFKPALKTDDGSGTEDADNHKADEEENGEEKEDNSAERSSDRAVDIYASGSASTFDAGTGSETADADTRTGSGSYNSS